MGILPRGGGSGGTGGGGTMEHEELKGRRGIGADGKAWHLDTDTYDRIMNMQFYRGAFADEDALKAAHPTDTIGSYAIVLSTQTFWIWGGMSEGWVDTGATVTEVSGLPPGGAAGQVLGKRSGVDGDADWINSLPSGGDAGQILAKASGADNDVEWIDPAAGGRERHNDLNGLQGGSATERFHMTDYQHSTVEAIAEGRPLQPRNLSPAEGAVNVFEKAVFESSPYSNPYGGEMYGYQIEIYASNGDLIYDSGNVELSAPVYRIPEGYLIVSTQYSWRVRYQAGNLRWSDWSEPTAFTTAADFSAYILTPALLKPSANDVLNSPYPTLITSPFNATGGLIQADGDFEISAASDFSTLADSGPGKNVFVGTQALTRGVLYWARARHASEDGQKSEYSFPRVFTVKNLYREQRIGIALIDEENWIFQRIDGNYLPVDIDGDYWLSNAIWAGWHASADAPVTINGNVMFSIPGFWINSGWIPSGPYAGKRFWMIDPTTPTQAEQEAGWHQHMAFGHPDGGYQDNLLIGYYFVNTSSFKSVAGTVGYTNTNNQSKIETTNNTDMTNINTRGFRTLTYQVAQMFMLLALIEYGGTANAYDKLVRPLNGAGNSGAGYRGFRGWNGPASAYPVLTMGIRKQSLTYRAGSAYLALPERLYPADFTGTDTLIAFAVKRLMSSKDGVDPLLNIDDYFIPLTSIPSVNAGSLPDVAGWPSRSAIWNGGTIAIVNSWNLELGMGNSQRGVLSLGANGSNPSSVAVNANLLMVKYD